MCQQQILLAPRSNFRNCHETDLLPQAPHVCYWGMN